MAMSKETVHLGADPICNNCGICTHNEILISASCYYIGRMCNCGPYSRESHYYTSRKTAAEALATNTVKWRKETREKN